MLRSRSSQKEIIDNLALTSNDLIENLKEMEFLNTVLRFNKSLIKSMQKVFNHYKSIVTTQKILLSDLGCGSGDSLRSIHDWAAQNALDLTLIGIDGNPAVIAYARQVSSAYSSIGYQPHNIGNISSEYDIVTLNNLCHHFSDEALINLLKSLKLNTRLAIIIHDLHRHIAAYFGIKLLAYLFRFSKITKHDGPLSVKRAFVKKELLALLSAANITDYEINWTWAFRWQIIIWCKEEII